MKNNKKGFANMILIGVIIALVAVGGYFAFVKKYKPITQEQTTSLLVPVTTNDTSNWKTYINIKYGYEFKYPENVGIVNEESSDYAGPPSNPEEDMLLLVDKENTFYIEIDKNVVNVIKKSPLSNQILSTFKFTK